MKLQDQYGQALSTAHAASAAAYDQALDLFNSFRADPLAVLAPALTEDPDFISGHLMQAGLMCSAFDPQLLASARESLKLAAASRHAPAPREQSLHAALSVWSEGDIDASLARFDRHLVDHPRDLFALQLAHLGDLMMGRTTMLRDRIARVLGHWSSDDAGYGYVLGMMAFGLEETFAFERAESLGRRAFELNPHDAWAVHAVAHVCEMQRRVADGITWMNVTRPTWRSDNAMAVHNHWHLALMLLAQGDHDATLALYDEAVAPTPESMAVDLVDASALLWRLQLRGVDAGGRWSVLAQHWAAQVAPGASAFLDVHAAMAFVAVDDRTAVDQLRRAATGAAEAPNASPAWRQIALPAIHAFTALLDGKPAHCADLLLPALPVTQPLGGSHAQRQVLLLTAHEAARRCGNGALAGALAAEQAVHRVEAPAPRRGAKQADTVRTLVTA